VMGEVMEGYGMYWCGSVYGTEAGSCEDGNKLSLSIKSEESL
jgi:hypothetical protein